MRARTILGGVATLKTKTEARFHQLSAGKERVRATPILS
jgi:hypothetical protein